MAGRQERVEPLDRAYDLSSLAAKWRQSHGVIAQCNSAARRMCGLDSRRHHRTAGGLEAGAPLAGRRSPHRQRALVAAVHPGRRMAAPGAARLLRQPGKPRSAHHPRSARHARWQRLPGAVREPRELVVHIPAIITKPTIDLESFRSRKVGQSRFSWPLTPDDRERVLAARTGGSSSPVTYGAWSIGASPRMAAWSGCVIMLCWCMADSESRAIGTGSSSISPSRSCIPETPLQLRRIRGERKAVASRLDLPSLLAGPIRRPREPRPAWADRVEAPTSVWPGSGGAGRLLC
jgi:hypothetical protein